MLHLLFRTITLLQLTSPYPAVVDTCAYFASDPYGTDYSKQVYNLTKSLKYPFVVHGWFPAIIKPKLQPRSISEFLSLDFPIKDIFYYDTKTARLEISKGVYAEYKKHGAASGYTLKEWHKNYVACSTLPSKLIPRICRFSRKQRINCVNEFFAFHKTHNIPTIGCRSGYAFKVCNDESF